MVYAQGSRKKIKGGRNLVDKKYLYTQAQMDEVFSHLDQLNISGVENAKRIGLIATVLENPEKIMKDKEGDSND